MEAANLSGPTWSSQTGRSRPTYEFRIITLPRTTPKNQVRELLSHEAEYGHWELARSVLYVGGARKLWLRRRVQRVVSTL